MNSLFKDFLFSKEELRPFYSWLPVDGIDKIHKTVSEYSQTDQNIIPVIVTGQQPAVFGGPLYTLYKIITSLKLSLYLNNTYGDKIQPVFWVHSWDHDWKEVCSINFLSYKYEIISFFYTPKTVDRGKSLYRLALDKNYFQQHILEIFKNIKGSEFLSTWREFLLDSILRNDNLSDWAVNILKHIFTEENLIFFEPHKITDFKLLQHLMEVAIDHHPLLFNEFNKTYTLLKNIGYKPQVHKVAENAFFFLDENGFRSRIKVQNGKFYSEVFQREYSALEMKKILSNEPERFSPNLLLRCIYQQMLFPCLIYVGGPAEVAYWAQMKDLFSFFKLPMPIVYPRCRFILLPQKIKKWLSEINICADDLPKIYNKIKLEDISFISDSQKSEIEIARIKFIESARDFFKGLTKIFNDNSLENEQRTFLSKIETETYKLVTFFEKTQRNKNEKLQKHLHYILNTIFPNGNEQERFFSPFSFIPEYGNDFIKMMINRADIGSYEIGVIEL